MASRKLMDVQQKLRELTGNSKLTKSRMYRQRKRNYVREANA